MIIDLKISNILFLIRTNYDSVRTLLQCKICQEEITSFCMMINDKESISSFVVDYKLITEEEYKALIPFRNIFNFSHRNMEGSFVFSYPIGYCKSHESFKRNFEILLPVSYILQEDFPNVHEAMTVLDE